jgi:hypothetical protein
MTWTIDESGFDRVELYPWDPEAAEEYPFLSDAVADFDATGQEHANRDAADEATQWLRRDALRQRAAVTRLFVVDQHIMSFYALVSAEMQIGSTQNLEEMGYFVPIGPPDNHRVGVSHIEVVARDHRAPKGFGTYAIQHAAGIAETVSKLQGNRALTLDPRDRKTEEMWRGLGFHKTQTKVQATGISRLYLPVFGPHKSALLRTP